MGVCLGCFLASQKDPGEQPLCANPLRLECGGLGVARFKIHVGRGGFGKDFRQWSQKKMWQFLGFFGMDIWSVGGEILVGTTGKLRGNLEASSFKVS